MNYKNIYHSIIEKAQNRNDHSPYTEKHHIKPKSLGGTNDKYNIVKLSAREHFICHYLLAKMYEMYSYEWYKLNHAFIIMKSASLTHKRYFNSRLYEKLRINFSIVMSNTQSGKNNTWYGKIWIYNPTIKKSTRIDKTDDIPDGWMIGRVINWDKDKRVTKTACIVCGSLFTSTRYTKICSKKCRDKSNYLNSPTAKYKPLLDKIRKDIPIIDGSVTRNGEFIIAASTNKIPKNQILWYLGCNNSGANYKLVNRILNTPVV